MDRIKYLTLTYLGIFLFCLYPNLAHSSEDITVTTFFPSPGGGAGSSGDATFAQVEGDHVNIGEAIHRSTNPFEGKLWIADASTETYTITTPADIVVPDIVLQNTSDTNHNYNRILFVNSVGEADSAIAGVHKDADATGTALRGKLQFLTADAAGLKARMTIESSGNVGIGTIDPTANLSIDYQTGDSNYPTIQISSAGNTTVDPTIRLTKGVAGTATSQQLGVVSYDTAGNDLIIRNAETNANADIIFKTNSLLGEDRMNIKGDGKVVIGKFGGATGTAQLTVYNNDSTHWEANISNSRHSATTKVVGLRNELAGTSTNGQPIYGVEQALSGTTGQIQGMNTMVTGAPNSAHGMYSLLNTTGQSQTGVVNVLQNTNAASGNQYQNQTGMYNNFQNVDGEQIGIHNYLRSSKAYSYGSIKGMQTDISDTGGDKMGVDTRIAGTGPSWGVQNILSNEGNKTGMYSALNGTSGSQIGVNSALYGTGSSYQYGVYNDIANTGTGNKYGVYNTIRDSTAAHAYGMYNDIQKINGTKFGVYNTVNNTAANNYTSYGTYNHVTGPSRNKYGTRNEIKGATTLRSYGTANMMMFNATDRQYGSYNYLGNNGSSSSRRYGSYNEISSGSGLKYGVWSSATGSGTSYGVYSNGDTADFYAVGGTGVTYASGSSRRWKTNIETMPNALNQVLSLRGVYFDWDEEHGGERTFGFIAEEVGEVLPEIVTYEEDSPKDAIGLDYSKITVVLVEAIKEQQKMIDELKAEVKLLKEKNN